VVSRCLSTAGICFSVIRYPPRDWALLTVGLPAQPSGRTGPGRGYRVSHARAMTGVGALSTPGTTVLTLTGVAHRPASAASQRHVPKPRHRQPIDEGSFTRHQRGFKQFTRPVFPSPVAPGSDGSRLGFPPSFAPRRPGAGRRTSGRGQAIEHGPETTLYVIDPASNLACSLECVRPRVARDEGEAHMGGAGARIGDCDSRRDRHCCRRSQCPCRGTGWAATGRPALLSFVRTSSEISIAPRFRNG
jgi:hypothetical protein